MSTLPRKTIEDIIEMHDHRLGGRRIAQKLGLTYGQVRWILDNIDGYRYQDAPQTRSDAPEQETFTAVRSCAWDLETTDLRADIGRLGVAAFLDLDTGQVESRTMFDFPGTGILDREELLIAWTAKKFAEYDVLVGLNSLGFDRNFLNGRMEKHRMGWLPKRMHADLMLIARYGLKGRIGTSMRNLLDFYGYPDKDSPSKEDWQLFIASDPDATERIRTRCIEDVYATARIFTELKPHWHRWRGQ